MAIGLLSGSAAATPGSGVSARTLAQGVTDGPVKVTTAHAATVLARTITIAPGGSTGWHYHPGKIIGVVVSGTLTRTLASKDGACRVLTSRPGDAFVEEGGRRHVHNWRNLGKTPVVLHATYILSPNSPASIDAKDPGCAR
ncbi:MAG TPA: cupin domain-containing protein [Mycobacteriales bacterium]|nr:cupin domain-containing protein [Mycobacteriales bacterium]